MNDEKLVAAADAQSASRPGAPGTQDDFERLARTIWRLRQQDGCPWDREQTHESIRKNMIEEAYETAEAIDEGNSAHLCEELGDVLMQVLLHAQIADDAGEFTLADVCRGLNEKLVRRHPHVFNDRAQADSADEVLEIWENVKSDEREKASRQEGKPVGLLDSVPHALPALMQCQKISKRAARVGFEWETVGDVWDKVEEEHQEFLAEEPGTPAAELEFGDMLFALVNVARLEGIDAEEALERSCEKFRSRWSIMEEMAREQGEELSEMGTDKLNELWNCVKQEHE